MKLKMPKFKFSFEEEIDFKKSLEENLRECPYELSFSPLNDFPFYCVITHDYSDAWYIYGFISTTEYFDEAFIISDDIRVNTNKQFITAYETVYKQLCNKYRKWVKENLYE